MSGQATARPEIVVSSNRIVAVPLPLALLSWYQAWVVLMAIFPR